MKGGNCTAQKVTASGQEVKRKLNARAFCFLKKRYSLSPLVYLLLCFLFLVVHTSAVVSTLLHTTTYPSTLPLLLSPNQGHHNTTSILFYFLFLFALVSVHTNPLLLYICTYLCPSSLLFLHTQTPTPFLILPFRPRRRGGGRVPQLPSFSTHS